MGKRLVIQSGRLAPVDPYTTDRFFDLGNRQESPPDKGRLSAHVQIGITTSAERKHGLEREFLAGKHKNPVLDASVFPSFAAVVYLVMGGVAKEIDQFLRGKYGARQERKCTLQVHMS